MSDKSKIEWCDATWNPITGCSMVSEGCTNCYAMKLAAGRLRNHPSREGLTTNGKWNGKVRMNWDWLDQPRKWKKPRRIFVCAHGDLFHEDVPDVWIAKIWEVMEQCPQHQFQVLTKRPARMFEWVNHQARIGRTEKNYPAPNIWLGTSAENQETADERIPYLLKTPAAVRFLSAEPLLGAIDLMMLHYDGTTNINALTGRHGLTMPLSGRGNKLDWVIVGGESGPGARECDFAHVRFLLQQCRHAMVLCFVKQLGDVPADSLDHIFDEHLKKMAADKPSWKHGRNMNCWPDGLPDATPNIYRMREMPV